MGMRVFQDGVRAMVLPDSAKCILAEKHPFEFEECPVWKCEDIDVCNPDCEFYTEYGCADACPIEGGGD